MLRSPLSATCRHIRNLSLVAVASLALIFGSLSAQAQNVGAPPAKEARQDCFLTKNWNECYVTLNEHDTPVNFFDENQTPDASMVELRDGKPIYRDEALY